MMVRCLNRGSRCPQNHRRTGPTLVSKMGLLESRATRGMSNHHGKLKVFKIMTANAMRGHVCGEGLAGKPRGGRGLTQALERRAGWNGGQQLDALRLDDLEIKRSAQQEETAATLRKTIRATQTLQE